jgi:saccharopine dehydrogenase (NAD+, L-lysine-forming)
VTTILILGGYGRTGLPLARHLLEQTGAHLVLAGRTAAKAERAAASFNAEYAGERVSAAVADGADPASLSRALAGADFMLVAATTVANTHEIIYTALRAGVDYLDIQYAPKRYAILASAADDIRRAGRCVITEAGFHPGLPAALARYVGAQFTRLNSVALGGVLNPAGGLPYTQGVDELVAAFLDYEAQTFKDGRWQAPSAFATRRIDFGAMGRRNCYSMYFEELGPLPELYPSLCDLGFYIAGFNWLVDYAILPAMMLALKIWPSRAVAPMGRLLCWGTRAFAAPPFGVALKAEASGEQAGLPAQAEVSLYHADGYEFTAIPVVACLLQYLDGSIRRPGLWMMGHLVDPARLLHDMERMGIRVAGRVPMPA